MLRYATNERNRLLLFTCPHHGAKSLLTHFPKQIVRVPLLLLECSCSNWWKQVRQRRIKNTWQANIFFAMQQVTRGVTDCFYPLPTPCNASQKMLLTHLSFPHDMFHGMFVDVSRYVHDMFVYQSGLRREPRHYKNVPRETHKGSRNKYDMFYPVLLCFTICLFISPDLDGNRGTFHDMLYPFGLSRYVCSLVTKSPD